MYAVGTSVVYMIIIITWNPARTSIVSGTLKQITVLKPLIFKSQSTLVIIFSIQMSLSTKPITLRSGISPIKDAG